MGQANVGMLRIFGVKVLAVTRERKWYQIAVISSGVMFGAFNLGRALYMGRWSISSEHK